MVSFELCEIHLDKKKFTNVSKEKKKEQKEWKNVPKGVPWWSSGYGPGSRLVWELRPPTVHHSKKKKKKKKDRENQLLNVILKLIFPLGFYFLTELWGLIIKCPLQNA